MLSSESSQEGPGFHYFKRRKVNDCVAVRKILTLADSLLLETK